jgi:hypothetical protein
MPLSLSLMLCPAMKTEKFFPLLTEWGGTGVIGYITLNWASAAIAASLVMPARVKISIAR